MQHTKKNVFCKLQVTVFGQSSGGTAIFGLLASRLSKGLFHKAWLSSASPILNKTATDAYKDNEIFLKNTNCTNLTCLYALTPEEVTSSVPWNEYPYWDMSNLGDLPTKNRFNGALAVVDGMYCQIAGSILFFFKFSIFRFFLV